MDMKKYLLLLAFTLPLLAQQTETDKEITKQEQRENRTATGVKEEGRQKKSWGKRAWMGLQDADWKKYNAAHDRAHNKKDGMRRGVDNRDWNTAADEMVDSNLYRQVGKRAKRLVNRMRDVGSTLYPAY